jgi:hypothetical protein
MNLFKNSHEGNFEFIQLPLILEVFHLFFVFIFFTAVFLVKMNNFKII